MKRRSTSHRPLDEERKKVFLKELARTGSMIIAARAASPHCIGDKGGVSSFDGLCKTDLEFATAVQEAKEHALAGVENEIHRRAMQPPRRPVWERGRVKGWVEDRNSSDKLLLRLAARLDPAWRERTSVDANINVQGTMLAITPGDILLLAAAERELFVEMLRKIADARGEDDDEIPQLPGGSGADSAT